MIVKTFTGSSVREALDKVRESFGPDAVILDTKFDRSAETRQGTAPNMVSITAAFETDNAPTPEIEGTKTLHVAESLTEGWEDASPETVAGADVAQPGPVAGVPVDAHLIELIHRLHADVRRSLGLKDDSGIWRALRQWLATQPELANSVVDAFATDLAESLPPSDTFLERRMKGQTILFVGGRGSGKSTALFKCLAARWQSRDRKPRLLILSDTEEHGQERLLAWCARCEIEAETAAIGRAGRLATHQRCEEEDLFIEYLPGGDSAAVAEAARKIRRGLKPDVVAQVLAANTGSEGWRSDCARLAVFTPGHLVVTRWDEMTPWWEIASLLREHRMAPAYRVSGFEPFAEFEPFSSADWRAGIAGCCAVEIGAGLEANERSRTS
ncbi:MAG TPA: hypothetical protein VM118_09820 [Acidobacteriota bacterium]|nr:hypothetical protein [Acidobacteriota bacterium]